MRKKILAQVFLAVGIICSFSSCGSSSNNRQDTFWEGRVKPGTYVGSWTHKSAGGTNRVEATLTIFDNRQVEYKQSETILWGDHKTTTELSRGYIEKHEETYNGERKVWYGIETKPEPGARYSHSMNLSTNLEFGGANLNTYQSFRNRTFECTLSQR